MTRANSLSSSSHSQKCTETWDRASYSSCINLFPRGKEEEQFHQGICHCMTGEEVPKGPQALQSQTGRHPLCAGQAEREGQRGWGSSGLEISTSEHTPTKQAGPATSCQGWKIPDTREMHSHSSWAVPALGACSRRQCRRMLKLPAPLRAAIFSSFSLSPLKAANRRLTYPQSVCQSIIMSSATWNHSPGSLFIDEVCVSLEQELPHSRQGA